MINNPNLYDNTGVGDLMDEMAEIARNEGDFSFLNFQRSKKPSQRAFDSPAVLIYPCICSSANPDIVLHAHDSRIKNVLLRRRR